MADANDLDLMTGLKEAGDGLSQGLNGAGRGLLDQNIAGNDLIPLSMGLSWQEYRNG